MNSDGAGRSVGLQYGRFKRPECESHDIEFFNGCLVRPVCITEIVHDKTRANEAANRVNELGELKLTIILAAHCRFIFITFEF